MTHLRNDRSEMLRMPKVTKDNPLANIWAIIILGKNNTFINNSSILCHMRFSLCRGHVAQCTEIQVSGLGMSFRSPCFLMRLRG